MDDQWTEQIVAELLDAQDAGRQIEPISARYPGFDRAAAYAVAARIHARRVANGARPIGRKIGFSNRTIWPRYGVYEPMWAHVYDTTTKILDEPWCVQSIGGLCEPRIEPEIVVHFDRTPDVADPTRILECVDWLALGFEIVQSHFPDWRFAATDTVADSGLHGALIVGRQFEMPRDRRDFADAIAEVTVDLYRESEFRERGSGANVLDSPLNAVAHLMTVLSSQPWAPPLTAGELVSTGTLTDAWPVRAGESWSANVSGLSLRGLAVTFRD